MTLVFADSSNISGVGVAIDVGVAIGHGTGGESDTPPQPRTANTKITKANHLVTLIVGIS